MNNYFNVDEMARLMRESRENTRQLLFDMVIAEKDLRRQPAEGFRPLLWHWGHVGAFESYWILQRLKGDASLSPHYDLIFDPIQTPKDDSLNLPPIAEIDDFLQQVHNRVIDYLTNVHLDDSNPLLRNGYIFDMILEHEYQHQETLMYLLQLLEPELKNRGLQIADCGLSETDSFSISNPGTELDLYVSNQSNSTHCVDRNPQSTIKIEGGAFEMGAHEFAFAYDNEQPLHMVELQDFRIDKFPVTNGEYAAFIEANGYHTRSLWNDEGWAWKEENKIEHPLYWSLANKENNDDQAMFRWHVRELFEASDLKLNHPVTGVSWHEAESFARFAGKRLPTEAEWEKAASWNPATLKKNRFSWGDELPDRKRANFGNLYWGTTPVDAFPEGQSAYGCFDMTGNVWEWTATIFDGYEGFTAFPYPEYSKLWFDTDHRVLKGGSWATRSPLLRTSFRNFWRPRFRIAFAGFRCAAD
jgi:gamma-glutamyl hercynylcysteine S-oxide synthase